MTLYFAILFFIFGLAFGSFFNVVGYRLPKKESLNFPPSHCTVCGHKLSFWETIPVISYLCLGGKCKTCKSKISWYYCFFELMTGFMFMLSYLKFGFSFNCFLSLSLVSVLIITIISDYKYFIIPDSIIILGIFLIGIGIFLNGSLGQNSFNLLEGLNDLVISLGHGFLTFLFMYFLKIIGDFLFGKEALGGGDIKLMFMVGMALEIPLSFFSVLLASIIALPFALFLTYKKEHHEIPFGPFLSIAVIFLFFLKNLI